MTKLHQRTAQILLTVAVLACTPALPGLNPVPAREAPEVPTWRVTVSGTAVGPDRKPVPGATVYLMTDNGTLLARTTTDAQGRYGFRNTPIPLREPGEDKDRTGVILQVCGTAPGLAFAWQPRMFLETPASFRQRQAPFAVSNSIRPADEPQKVDLVFGRPHAFSGRIVDDQGQPVVGAKVHLRFGDWLRRLWPTSDTSFWALGGALPPDMTTATTGPDGRFHLGGVPYNFLARFDITHPDYADIDLYAATTDTPVLGKVTHFMAHPDAGPDNPIWTGPIDLTLVKPRTIPVRVVSDTTGEPLKDIRVSLWNRGKVRVQAYGTTEASGRTVLHMPPGDYTLMAQAPHGAEYVRLADKLTVAKEPADQPRTVRLVPGCVVVVEAVDAETGFPIRRARFQHESEQKPGWWSPLESETGYYSGHPETDKWGKLRVVIRPGRRRIAPDTRFDVVEGPKEPMELAAGKEVHLRFSLRERD